MLDMLRVKIVHEYDRANQNLGARVHLILEGRSISADNLLVRVRDLLPKCFAPTSIFAKMRCTRGRLDHPQYLRLTPKIKYYTTCKRCREIAAQSQEIWAASS